MDNLYKSIHPVPVGKKSQNGFTLNVRKKVVRPLRVGRSGMYHSGDNGLFSGKIDDIYLFSKDLTTLESLSIFNSYDISEKNVDKNIVKNHWIESDSRILRNKKELSALRGNWLKIMEPVNAFAYMIPVCSMYAFSYIICSKIAIQSHAYQQCIKSNNKMIIIFVVIRYVILFIMRNIKCVHMYTYIYIYIYP